MSKKHDSAKLKNSNDIAMDPVYEGMEIKKTVSTKSIRLSRCDFRQRFVFDRLCRKLGVKNIRHVIELRVRVVDVEPVPDPEPSW